MPGIDLYKGYEMQEIDKAIKLKRKVFNPFTGLVYRQEDSTIEVADAYEISRYEFYSNVDANTGSVILAVLLNGIDDKDTIPLMVASKWRAVQS